MKKLTSCVLAHVEYLWIHIFYFLLFFCFVSSFSCFWCFRLQTFADIGTKCASFAPGERPCFVDLATLLDVKDNEFASSSHSSRETSASAPSQATEWTAMSVPLLLDDEYTSEDQTVASAVILRTEVDSRSSVDVCKTLGMWKGCWARCQLHFGSEVTEHKFRFYVHGPAFYKSARSYFLLLASTYLTITIALAAVSAWVPAIQQFLVFSSFGASAVFGCAPSMLCVVCGPTALQMLLLCERKLRICCCGCCCCAAS